MAAATETRCNGCGSGISEWEEGRCAYCRAEDRGDDRLLAHDSRGYLDVDGVTRIPCGCGCGKPVIVPEPEPDPADDIEQLRDLIGHGQKVEIRLPQEPVSWRREWIEGLGGVIVIDPSAPMPLAMQRDKEEPNGSEDAAAVVVAETKPTRAELAETVRVMLLHGVTQQFVADQLGISRSYVCDLVNDPDGSKGRARKDSYRKACPGYDGTACGRPMDGSNGRGPDAPTLCASCTTRRRHEERRWTAEACLAAGRLWLTLTGEPPRSGDWTPSLVTAGQGLDECERRRARLSELGERRFPDAAIAAREFGSWVAFREALGYPVPPGNYERTDEFRARFGEVVSKARRRKSWPRYVELFETVRALEQTLGRPPLYVEYAAAVERPISHPALAYRLGEKAWLRVIWIAAAGGEEAYR